jgi:hypothetical protein
MANGRNKSRKGDAGRDSGGFVALPWAVLDCPAYARLSMHARALLLEVARQYVRDNNGRLLLSRAYMGPRGWKSMDMLNKAKNELVANGFIFQTVMGHRPSKASWYAVTWRALDKLPGYDVGTVEGFRRGAYQHGTPLIDHLTAPPHGTENGASLGPPHGTARASTVPPHGTETTPTVPPHGAVEGTFGTFSVPPHGHHLENHLPQQEREVFKAVKNAPPATTKAADLVQVDDEQNDHADQPRTPPARRKKKEGVSWIQFELMA